MFLEVLSKQVWIIEEKLLTEMKEEEAKTVRERYYRLLDLFWRGKYSEANDIADSLRKTAN
jgi:hypothetical protein